MGPNQQQQIQNPGVAGTYSVPLGTPALPQPGQVAYPQVPPVQPTQQPGMAAPAPQPMTAQPMPMAAPQPTAAPTMPYAAQTPGAPLPNNMPGMPVVAGGSPAPGTPTPQTAPAAHTNPNSTQNTLQIAEIRDGIVIMNDGSFRSVVMVKSINFDLMSPQEQEAVEFSYQGFLNSLYFPIQIFVKSQKVDLQPYIERLDKIRTEHDNMLLAMLMDDYIGYIDQLAAQTNIMDKKFYVVVPYFLTETPQKALTQSKSFFTGIAGLFNKTENHVVINEADLEKAKTELRNRVQAVLSGLLQCGIQGLPLDTQELIELYYDTYNPDTATRQQLKNFADMTADIVTKGAGIAQQAHLRQELQ